MKNEEYTANFKALEKQLKSDPNKGSFGLLLRDVINVGKCIECGGCVAVCEYNALAWNTELGKPELVDRCVACGMCYQQCPESTTNLALIGPYQKGYIARNPQLDQSQDGGVTTSLLQYLLKQNHIEAAVLTKRAATSLAAETHLATTEEELLTGQKSVYSHSQVIIPLITAIKQGLRKIAVVGTPCSVKMIHQMLHKENGLLKNYPDLKIWNIGLFCLEAFNPSVLQTLIEGQGIDTSLVDKMGFEGGRFVVWDKEKKPLAKMKIKSLESAIESSCKRCEDFTSAYADISIGNSGSPIGYNTVLVRTEESQTILEEMIEKGILETQEVTKDMLKTVRKLAQSKQRTEKTVISEEKEQSAQAFNRYHPRKWNVDNYDYSPELTEEAYKTAEFSETSINEGEGEPVLIAHTPQGSRDEITTHNYASSYELTKKLFENRPKIKGAKILIKPNNTGFVGVFKNEMLNHVLEKNGITDNADHQPIATQPGQLKGAVDALLDLGVARIDIGENMLWDGGVKRAFYETGYPQIFSDKRYVNKVFFIDFYENDPPADRLKEIEMEKTQYCEYDYYNHFYPPAALFNEKYDFIYQVVIAKAHNCAYYTLSAKGFSISMNPRKKTGKIEPRWHIHGLPFDIFRPSMVKKIGGPDFERKHIFYVREAYKHRWDHVGKRRCVTPEKAEIIFSNKVTSSGLIKTFKSFGNWALNVDPHHWAGINTSLLTLGMGYLINRYTRIFGTLLKRLKEKGTEFASLISGIVAQEGDGPLIYGSTKYGGFNIASFDQVALERVCLDIMFGTSEGGFKEFMIERQKQRLERQKIDCPELIDEAGELWTLKILHDLLVGNLETATIPMTLLDFSKESKNITPKELYKLRLGKPFKDSLGYYCNPDLWLKLLHTNDDLYFHAFEEEKGDIEIPLIPGVV